MGRQQRQTKVSQKKCTTHSSTNSLWHKICNKYKQKHNNNGRKKVYLTNKHNHNEVHQNFISSTSARKNNFIVGTSTIMTL